MSDSVRPHRRQPTRLPRPWDSPGKNTGVGCHFLLQCMKVKSGREVTQSCPTLATPWTAAYQAPLSMRFARQEYWSGLPLPSPRRLKRLGFNPWIWKRLQGHKESDTPEVTQPAHTQTLQLLISFFRSHSIQYIACYI